jgi:hypothetical protein
MKTKTVTATIGVSIPIIKKIPYEGFVLNIGALTLSLGGRNFILDSTDTNYNNPKKKGKNFTFETELSVDLDTFEEGEEYNYNLTEKDLKNKNLKAEFYCSDSDVGIDDAFDFDAAEISCTVYVDGKSYEVNVTFE